MVYWQHQFIPRLNWDSSGHRPPLQLHRLFLEVSLEADEFLLEPFPARL